MTPFDPIRVFLDASCLVAAAGSPSGGSSHILVSCASSPIQIISSESALAEAERAVQLKMNDTAYQRLQALKAQGLFGVVTAQGVSVHLDGIEQVNEKDRHIVLSAYSGGCIHLVTLDRPLMDEVINATLPLYPWTPDSFIKHVMRPVLEAYVERNPQSPT